MKTGADSQEVGAVPLTYFFVAGSMVSTTNTVNNGRVAAMVVTRDTRAASVDAVIASHYNDDHDSRHDLPQEIATARDHLHRLRRVRGR